MGALSVSDAGVQSMTKESFVDVKSRITRDEFRTTFAELDKIVIHRNLRALFIKNSDLST